MNEPDKEELQRAAEKEVNRQLSEVVSKIGASVAPYETARSLLPELWTMVGKTIESGRVGAARSATERSLTTLGMSEDEIRFEVSSVEPKIGRVTRDEKTVYQRTRANLNLSLRWVDRERNISSFLKETDLQAQNRYARLFRPGVPGGVSYLIKRYLITDMRNTYRDFQIEVAKRSVINVKINWNTSNSHQGRDICDDYAAGSPYAPSRVPKNSHPRCQCHLTYELP